MVAAGTVDEDIYLMGERKKEVNQSVLNDAGKKEKDTASTISGEKQADSEQNWGSRCSMYTTLRTFGTCLRRCRAGTMRCHCFVAVESGQQLFQETTTHGVARRGGLEAVD